MEYNVFYDKKLIGEYGWFWNEFREEDRNSVRPVLSKLRCLEVESESFTHFRAENGKQYNMFMLAKPPLNKDLESISIVISYKEN